MFSHSEYRVVGERERQEVEVGNCLLGMRNPREQKYLQAESELVMTMKENHLRVSVG